MPILNDIAAAVNSSLTESLFSQSRRFAGAKLFGVCEQAVRSGEAAQEFPVIVDLKGEGVYAGIDDSFNLIMYHRRSTMTVTDDTSNRGYGDGRAASVNNYAMVMVIYFNRAKLQMEPDELAMFIQKHFPSQIKDDKFHYLSLSFDSVILNAPQVFRSEYAGVQYFLKPEHSLVSISYTIEGKPRMACFNRCPE